MRWLPHRVERKLIVHWSEGQEGQDFVQPKASWPCKLYPGPKDGSSAAIGTFVVVQSGCRSQTFNKDLKGRWGASLLGGCHGHYPGGSESSPSSEDQPLNHIYKRAASPPSPPHALFEVECGNLSTTHRHANNVNLEGAFHGHGNEKKVVEDGWSKVVEKSTEAL